MAKRVCWSDVIEYYGLEADFKHWLKSKKRKKISDNRLGYCFFKSRFGSQGVKLARQSSDNIMRILKTPWIKVLDDE